MNLEGLVWVAPFALLLGAIAVMPLANKHWWEKWSPAVSLGLGALVALHAILAGDSEVLVHTAVEYVSFICLIGSLFIIAGGIHIKVKGESTPAVNCLFLAIGAVLANLLGTTGASMVLIRPWLRMNKYRITAFHVVFFIFIVSNAGGSLTPIGDPPLFLGYLKGVPFFWVTKAMFLPWLAVVGLLIAIFFVLDTKNFAKAPVDVRVKETGAGEEWRFEGKRNVFFLLAVVGSVFIQSPSFLREAVMVAAAFLSFKMTPKAVHEMNDFEFGPIREVALLFMGIFATMIPALEWLETNAASLGIRTAGHFYWGSGVLSSVLDNAPTYLNFLSAALGLFTAHASGALPHGGHDPRVAELLATHGKVICAISAGSVFFGAMTYIGNGPNFLVKSIADRAKAHTPSFFGYILRYSLPYLLPVLALVWFLFFRG